MADPFTWIAIGSAVVGAVGTGYSIYQSNQAAKTAQQQGELQALIGAQSARQQGEAGRIQAQIGFAQAESQRKAAEAEAANLRQQAGVLGWSDLEGQARQRLADRRFIAAQEAATAKSGLVAAGTPLELMVETAGLQQLSIAETHRQAELERLQLLHSADLAEFQGSQFAMQGLDSKLQGVASLAAANRGRYDSEIARLAGYQQAKAYKAQAVATGIQGVSNLAGSVTSIYQNSGGGKSAGYYTGGNGSGFGSNYGGGNRNISQAPASVR